MTAAPATLRAAVIGVGHLGTFHARLYANMPDVDLCYVADIDRARVYDIAAQCGAEPRDDYRDILGRVDIASIVTPTPTHHAIARDSLGAGVSVLIEKPMAATADEADDLIRIAEARGLTIQVGHVERFNPAYRAARPLVREPVFIECRRLSPYPFRSTGVSVVLDVMIHDLDLILDLVGSPPATVEAVGASVVSGSTDIANARLRFDRPDGRRGCIADVAASRVSPRSMRRLQVFQPDACISMDLLAKEARVFRKKPGIDLADATPQELGDLARAAREAEQAGGPAMGRLLDIRDIEVRETNALNDELAAFVQAVRDEVSPAVPGEHGRRALALAARIEEDIERSAAPLRK